MMINRRMFLAGSASTAVLAALAACASSSNSDGGSENLMQAVSDAASESLKQAVSDAGSESLKQAINVVARDKVKDGGELKFALSDPITNWNNATVEGNTGSMSQILGFIFPSLFLYDSAGKATPRPEFLKSIKDEVKNGKTIVSIKLNDKAVWGDGKKIVADDYIKTMQSATNKDYAWASTDGLVDIEKFDKESDTKFSITWKSTYPDWSSVITVMPQAQVATPAVFNDGVNDVTKYKNEWFAGPYKIESYNEAQQVVTLVPNEKWWGDKPLLDKVTFRVLDSAAEATSFANKEIDVLDYIISANTYKQAQTRSDAEVRQNFGLQWRHFTLNASSGVLADKAVRQALMRATDRAAITKSSLAGMPVDANKVLLGNHFFMPSQEGYVDNSTKWSHDVEAAKKLLDGAGWKEPSPGAIRVKDGKKLSIKYTRPTAVPTTKTESELLQSQLKKIGMEVVMEDVESAKYFKDYINKKNFEITSFTWQGTPYPMMNIGQIYGKGNSNFTGQSIKELNELIDKINVEADQKKRVAMTNQADEIIWENVMNFPIYQRPDLCGVPKKLANYGAFGLATVRGEDVGFVD